MKGYIVGTNVNQYQIKREDEAPKFKKTKKASEFWALKYRNEMKIMTKKRVFEIRK